jgi:flagellar motor switch protein FliM
MAEDILSQEEVDALLRGIPGEAEAGPGTQPPQGGIRPYAIGRQERIVRRRMPALERINEQFARRLRSALSDLAHRNTEVCAGPVRILKFSELVRNLVVPASLNLIQVRPLHGMGLMVIEPALVAQLVEQMFGGDGKLRTRIAARDFTPTEIRIIRRVLDIAFDCYRNAWQPVFPLECEYVRAETSPQFATIAAPAELVVVTTFSIDLGSGSTDFHVCMPYAMLEPIRAVLHDTGYADRGHADRGDADQRWSALLASHLYGAQVELTANLATAEVTVRQLLALQAGDVIALDLEPSITAEVDGVPVMRCSYGVVDGSYALKVEQPVGGG